VDFYVYSFSFPCYRCRIHGRANAGISRPKRMLRSSKNPAHAQNRWHWRPHSLLGVRADQPARSAGLYVSVGQLDLCIWDGSAKQRNLTVHPTVHSAVMWKGFGGVESSYTSHTVLEASRRKDLILLTPEIWCGCCFYS
jgi:hypothetical protein